MDAEAAQTDALDRALALDPREFEQLCKIVLHETLPATELSVAPPGPDDGVDIDGRLVTEWVAADIGVQVKRYARGNRVGNGRVHRLGGALAAGGYHVGALVTTSSFTAPARAAAEDLPIRLVDGEAFAGTAVRSGVGYRYEKNRYEPIRRFWDRIGDANDVDTGDVPLASNLTKVVTALTAMRHTSGTVSDIRQWMSDDRNNEVSDRHARINANGAVILGLARKEPGPDGNLRYGLTDEGAAILANDPGSDTWMERLHEGIRGAVVVQRCLGQMRHSGLTTSGINEIVAEVAGLSESSARRRSATVRTWLRKLPEVTVHETDDGERFVVE